MTITSKTKKTLIIIYIITTTIQTRKGCASRIPYSSNCLKCQNTKYNPKTQNCEIPKNPIQNCKEYTNSHSTKCLFCNYGFGKTPSGLCKKCLIKNCAICDNNIFLCKSCFNGYISNSENCYKNVLNKCFTNYCAICDVKNQDICYKCKLGYSLNRDNECVKGIPNCDIVDSYEKCFLCESGFFMNKNFSCVLDEFKEFYFLKNLLFWSVFLVLVISIVVCYVQVFKKEYLNKDDKGDEVLIDNRAIPFLRVSEEFEDDKNFDKE